MIKRTRFFLLFIPLPMLAKVSLQSVTGYFTPRSYEQVVQKKYSVKKPVSFSLENIDGTINIRTTHNQHHIIVSALKKTSTLEGLQEISIDETIHDNTICLRTMFDTKELSATVDYTVMVPPATHIQLTTTCGSIEIHNSDGTVKATTKQGSIECFGTQGALELQCKKEGGITVHQPSGNLTLTCAQGSIIVYDALGSVNAQTEHGNIELFCKKVPTKSSLQLKTTKGSINVHMPKSTSAQLHAKTDKGHVLSEHLITIQPYATYLNNHAWQTFKQEVRGVIGTGEALITLQSHAGSINIMDYA